MQFSNYYVPSKINANAMSIKIFLNFVTVPMYLFVIFYFEYGLEKLRFKVKEGSTTENPIIEDGSVICISRDMGNIREWANIELVTFYGNIFIMICYLIKFSIFNHERPNTLPDCQADSEQLVSQDKRYEDCDREYLKKAAEELFKHTKEKVDLLQTRESER